MDTSIKGLEAVNAAVWGSVPIYLLLGMGLYFTLRTGFVQMRLLVQSIWELGKGREGA